MSAALTIYECPACGFATTEKWGGCDGTDPPRRDETRHAFCFMTPVEVSRETIAGQDPSADLANVNAAYVIERDRVRALEEAIVNHLAADFGPDWNARCRVYEVDDLSARLADALGAEGVERTHALVPGGVCGTCRGKGHISEDDRGRALDALIPCDDCPGTGRVPVLIGETEICGDCMAIATERCAIEGHGTASLAALNEAYSSPHIQPRGHALVPVEVLKLAAGWARKVAAIGPPMWRANRVAIADALEEAARPGGCPDWPSTTAPTQGQKRTPGAGR
jgi:hypothetical protein